MYFHVFNMFCHENNYHSIYEDKLSLLLISGLRCGNCNFHGGYENYGGQNLSGVVVEIMIISVLVIRIIIQQKHVKIYMVSQLSLIKYKVVKTRCSSSCILL